MSYMIKSMSDFEESGTRCSFGTYLVKRGKIARIQFLEEIT